MEAKSAPSTSSSRRCDGPAWRTRQCSGTRPRPGASRRYAAVQLEKLGLPGGRTEVIPHYIPAPAFAEQTRADRGQFALAFGRLAAEKGFECAIDASAISGVPLKIAGEGPLEQELARRIEREH